MASSYRHVDDTVGDAASRVAASLKALDQEQKRKKKEADELYQTFRHKDPETVQARTAAEIAALEEQRKRKQTAEERNIGIENGSEEGDDTLDSPSNKLEDIQSRTAAELNAVQEERKKKTESSDDDDSSSAAVNNLEQIQSRTAEEVGRFAGERSQHDGTSRRIRSQWC